MPTILNPGSGTPGTGCNWYFVADRFYVWPNTTGTFQIHYLVQPPALVNMSDRSFIPQRFTDVLVDGAVLKALKDDDDWTEHFPLLRQEYDRRVMDMIQFYDRGDQPDQIELGWTSFSRIGG